jgi:hypothetical protein
MAHIDPRRHRKKAKALDVANLSVKGRHGPSQPSEKKMATKLHRTRKKRQIAKLRDFVCEGSLDCECPACSDEVLGFSDQQIRRQEPYHACLGGHDVLGPSMKIARHMIEHFESFDEWYSWLKAFFPDTLAGRHAMNHILQKLDDWVECTCFQRPDVIEAKGNFRSCSCGLAFGGSATASGVAP